MYRLRTMTLMGFGMHYRCHRLSSALSESRRQGPALRPQRSLTWTLDTAATQWRSRGGRLPHRAGTMALMGFGIIVVIGYLVMYLS